jgi:hypothetical protein
LIKRKLVLKIGYLCYKSTLLLCDDNLFLSRTNEGDVDELRNALSCAVLRLCAQIVPYLLELEGPLRDFINCGFITALQVIRFVEHGMLVFFRVVLKCWNHRLKIVLIWYLLN